MLMLYSRPGGLSFYAMDLAPPILIAGPIPHLLVLEQRGEGTVLPIR